jgi:chemotaxis protein CheX
MNEQRRPSSDELLAIAEMVWTSYLDPEGEYPLVVDGVPEPGTATADVVATVEISGAWRGRVLLSFSPPAAGRAAAALLGFDEGEEVADGDVADAVGELANIIGGSVKSLMPQPTALSLPAVTTDGSADRSGTVVCRLSGTWRGEPVSVAVQESAALYVGVSRTGETSR